MHKTKPTDAAPLPSLLDSLRGVSTPTPEPPAAGLLTPTATPEPPTDGLLGRLREP